VVEPPRIQLSPDVLWRAEGWKGGEQRHEWRVSRQSDGPPVNVGCYRGLVAHQWRCTGQNVVDISHLQVFEALQSRPGDNVAFLALGSRVCQNRPFWHSDNFWLSSEKVGVVLVLLLGLLWHMYYLRAHKAKNRENKHDFGT